MSQQITPEPDNPLLVDWPIDAEVPRTQLRQVREKADKLHPLAQHKAVIRLAQKEIECRNRVIKSLTAFTYQISRMTGLADLLQLALIRAMETTQVEIGAIVLIDRETKHFSVSAHKNLTPALARILNGQQFDAGAAILMPHLIAGQGVLLELDAVLANANASNANASSANANEGEQLLLTAGQVISLASLPIQAGAQVLGSVPQLP